MTFEIGIVLFLLLLAIALFATEKISADVVAFLLLFVLISFGILTPAEAFSGFGSEFIIIIGCMFVISGALKETGVLDYIVQRFVKSVNHASGLWLYSLVMIIPGTLSAFMNNTTVTALFISPIMAICKKLKLNPSRFLMPLAFTSILGGTCTLIGTSTNVVVSAYLSKMDFPAIRLFEITPIGLIIFGVGFIYMMTIGRWMLPKSKEGSLTDEYSMKEYLTEIVVMPDSELIEQTVADSKLSKLGFTILKIVRSGQDIWPYNTLQIQEKDTLLVEGKLADLIKIKETSGIEIKADVIQDKDLQAADIKLAELLVTPKSELLQNPIKRMNLRQRLGLVVLAVHRFDESLRERISRIQLKVGDTILVQGSEENIKKLNSRHGIILEEFKPVLYAKTRGTITFVAFILAVVLASFDVVPLSVCFLGAALISIAIKSITIEKVYDTVDWRILALIGGMTAFGVAMVKTGASSYIASIIVNNLQDFGITAILAGFIILTVFLTQPMSNAAAALVVLPIAMQTAAELGLNPRTVAIMIMLSASVSIITPFEPSCLLVYGPGRYKFRDFIKVGSLLTFILVIIILFMTPVFWPLYK